MPFEIPLVRVSAGEEMGLFPNKRFAEAQPFENEQETLHINMSVVLEGLYPSRDVDGPGGTISLGYVTQWAANFAPRSYAFGDGQLLAISQNTALFSILGTTYGGDGRTTFQLPDFRDNLAVSSGRADDLTGYAIRLGERFGSDTHTLTEANLPLAFGGSGQGLSNYETSLGVNYVIHTGGSALMNSANFAGSVHMFLGNFDPGGAMICDGRTLLISEYPELYSAIGTIYGGDGVTTFDIPDLRGKTIVGSDTDLPVGTLVGSEQVVLNDSNMPTAVGGSGASFDNQQPGVAMQVLIAYQGIFPSRSMEPTSFLEAPQTDGSTANLSQIVYYAGVGTPTGFFPAEGQLLSIASYSALFSLLGTTYGGDGRTTFALPDFGGRASSHRGSGANEWFGDVNGQDDVTLAFDAIPGRSQDGDADDNTITGSDGDDQFNGFAGRDILTGNGGNDALAGGDGDDILDGGWGLDRLFGAQGDDVVEGGSGHDYLDGGDHNDDLRGGAQGDVLFGRDGDDFLRGGKGQDKLFGNYGDDIITGDGGDDAIYGGPGRDRLFGNEGADTFVFTEGDFAGLLPSDADIIADFTPSEGDRIDLSSIDAIDGNADDAFSFIGTDPFDGSAGQLRYSHIGSLTMVEGDTNGDGVADFAIRLNGTIPLTLTDFVL